MTCTATFDVTSGALGEPAMRSAVGAAVASEARRGGHRTATPRWPARRRQGRNSAAQFQPRW